MMRRTWSMNMAERNGGLPGADENVMPGIDQIFGQASAFEIGLIAAGAVLTLAVAVFFLAVIWSMHRRQQKQRGGADGSNGGEGSDRDDGDQPERDAKT